MCLRDTKTLRAVFSRDRRETGTVLTRPISSYSLSIVADLPVFFHQASFIVTFFFSFLVTLSPISANHSVRTKGNPRKRKSNDALFFRLSRHSGEIYLAASMVNNFLSPLSSRSSTEFLLSKRCSGFS